MCKTQLESGHPEAFSSLSCAVFEEILVANALARLLPNIMKEIIDRAKKVQKENTLCKKIVMD